MFTGSVCSRLVVVEIFLTGKLMLWKTFLIVRIDLGVVLTCRLFLLL